MIKNDFLIRLTAMTNKEFHQLMRDNSSILIGIFLPIILIFIIGYGVSLDVKKVPIATVLEDTSPTVHEVLSFLNGSEYFAPIYVTSMHEAKELMDNRDVDAIIRIPSDFSKNLYTRGSSMQLILYGVDSTTATTVKGYVEGSVKQWEALNKARFINGSTAGIITVENRMWFNDANSSIWYFIPGLIVLIITIVGVFLTSLVMAREWERGTLESLFISPIKPLEILLSKMSQVISNKGIYSFFSTFVPSIASINFFLINYTIFRYIFQFFKIIICMLISSVSYLFISNSGWNI